MENNFTEETLSIHTFVIASLNHIVPIVIIFYFIIIEIIETNQEKMDQFNSDPWPSPPIIDGLSDQMDSLADLQQEGAFEPQIRARSNTWPLPRPENFVDQGDDADNNQQCNNQQSVTGKHFLQRHAIS